MSSERRCAQCGTDIAHKRSNAQYCSRTCKSAACHVRIRQGSPAEKLRNKKRYGQEAPKRRAYAVAYYAQHRESRQEYSRMWRAENPDKRRMQQQNRRSLKHNNPGYVPMSGGEWVAMKHRFANRCAYCANHCSALQVEHVIPLSRGGRHAPGNIVPACPACNYSKGAMFLMEWRLSKAKRGGDSHFIP